MPKMFLDIFMPLAATSFMEYAALAIKVLFASIVMYIGMLPGAFLFTFIFGSLMVSLLGGKFWSIFTMFQNRQDLPKQLLAFVVISFLVGGAFSGALTFRFVSWVMDFGLSSNMRWAVGAGVGAVFGAWTAFKLFRATKTFTARFQQNTAAYVRTHFSGQPINGEQLGGRSSGQGTEDVDFEEVKP